MFYMHVKATGITHVLACFSEFCSHIRIKDRVLGEMTPPPLYIGDKEAI